MYVRYILSKHQSITGNYRLSCVIWINCIFVRAVALAGLRSLPVDGGFRVRSCTARCDVTVDINLFKCLVNKFPTCGTFAVLLNRVLISLFQFKY